MADDGTALGRWPSFRAALETARRGTRGHLEAFLGVAPGTSEPRRPPRGSRPREPRDLRPYGVAVLMVAVALGVAFPLAQVFDVPNAPLVFIAPIVVSAVRHGRAPPRCWPPPWPRSPTTSSSCRLSTRSRSPPRPTSSRSSAS